MQCHHGTHTWSVICTISILQIKVFTISSYLKIRWLTYSAVGSPIEGTRFIAFKVPLDNLDINKVSKYIHNLIWWTNFIWFICGLQTKIWSVLMQTANSWLNYFDEMFFLALMALTVMVQLSDTFTFYTLVVQVLQVFTSY